MSESEKSVGSVESLKSKRNPKCRPPIYSVREKILTPFQVSVVNAILRKSPAETWSRIAKKMGISIRYLYDLRTDQDIVDTINRLSYELLYSDIPDVLKALSEKAKSGDIAAIKLLLEQTDALKQLEKKVGDNMERSRQAIQRIMIYLSPEQSEIIVSEFTAVTKAWQEGKEDQKS